MTPKKLDPESIYAKYDVDHDGTVSDEEIKRHQELIELELKKPMDKDVVMKLSQRKGLRQGFFDCHRHFA